MRNIDHSESLTKKGALITILRYSFIEYSVCIKCLDCGEYGNKKDLKNLYCSKCKKHHFLLKYDSRLNDEDIIKISKYISGKITYESIKILVAKNLIRNLH